MKIDDQLTTSIKHLDFGNYSTLSTATGGGYNWVERNSAGEVVILTNSVIIKGIKIYFDDENEGFDLIPQNPLFFRHKKRIRLKIPDAITNVVGNNTIIDSSIIKILVFDKKEYFFTYPKIYSVSDYLQLNVLAGSTILVPDFLNATHYNLTLKTASGNHVHCYEIQENNAFYQSNVISLCVGYLAVGTTSIYGEYDKIIIPKIFPTLLITERYNKDTVASIINITFLPMGN